MPYRKLKRNQIQELKTMALSGVTPADMAKYFDIAISTIHNYKRRLSNKGVTFPKVRGKRSTGYLFSVDELKAQKREENNQILQEATDKIKLVVNGVSFQVGKNARVVNITDQNQLEITF